MKRRNFVKKLLLAPVAAALVTSLNFDPIIPKQAMNGEDAIEQIWKQIGLDLKNAIDKAIFAEYGS